MMGVSCISHHIAFGHCGRAKGTFWAPKNSTHLLQEDYNHRILDMFRKTVLLIGKKNVTSLLYSAWEELKCFDTVIYDSKVTFLHLTVGSMDKRRYKYVLTLFTLQFGTLMCTAHMYGPYIEGHPRWNKFFFVYDV